jgi:predicted SprT family Zn-dependent metalloprotease
MKSKSEVQDMVNRICENFQTPIPTINYTWKGRRGNARFLTLGGVMEKTILNLSVGCWTGIEQLICHETAHLIHYKRTNYVRLKDPHGVEFTNILLEVSAFVKNEFDFTYNFSVEYPSVAKAAGVEVMPYGHKRQVEAAVNTAMLLGLSRRDAEEFVKGVLQK